MEKHFQNRFGEQSGWSVTLFSETFMLAIRGDRSLDLNMTIQILPENFPVQVQREKLIH